MGLNDRAIWMKGPPETVNYGQEGVVNHVPGRCLIFMPRLYTSGKTLMVTVQ